MTMGGQFYFTIYISPAKVARNEQNGSLDAFPTPMSFPMGKEVIRCHFDFLWCELLIAFALPHLDTVFITSIGQKVYTILRLPTRSIDLAYSNIRFHIEKIAAQLLKNILLQLMKRWSFARTDSWLHYDFFLRLNTFRADSVSHRNNLNQLYISTRSHNAPSKREA